MKKLMLFAVLISCVAAARAQQPSTGAAEAGVPIEEYVPKVIIEGKWGTGPGEFGAIADPMQSEQYGVPQFPGSLAVNGHGEIYVLDHVNGRIQKFSKEGKYLLSLAVPGCADENGKSAIEIEKGDISEVSFELRRKPATVGINIVIDSKDNLYYYLKSMKDGKERGEVWQFRNDKLVKKTKVPVSTMLSYGVGLNLDRDDDSLWIPEVDKTRRGRHYQFRTGKTVGTEEVRKQREAFNATEAGKRARERSKPKYYLDIVTSADGVKVVEKPN